MARVLPVAVVALLALSAQVGRAAGRPLAGTHAQGRDVPVLRPAPQPDRAVTTVGSYVVPEPWRSLAACESDGDWQANTGNGYFGGVQFSLQSWRWVGGTGLPHEASRAEQIARARVLLSRQGWSAWPACSRALGLRGAS